MNQDEWDLVISRLKVVHARYPESQRRVLELVEQLRTGHVKNMPGVSGGWLLYEVPDRAGHINVSLAGEEGYRIVLNTDLHEEKWSRCVGLQDVVGTLEEAFLVAQTILSPEE